MDRVIEIKINGSHLTKDNLYAGVQGEANVTALRIEFDESWDGYLKTVVFWDAKGENPVKRTLNADMLEDAANSRIYRCMIPGEPLAEAGECTIIVDGYVEGKRPRTIPVKLKVRPAPDSENAAAPTDPTPTQAEHLQEQIDMLEEKFEGVIEAVENIPEGTATPIVNNLTTGGTTMALSAEMGKKLKNETVSKAGDVMTGKLVSSSRWTGALGSDVDDASVRIEGGTDFDKGAFLTLHGKASWGGMFQLVAGNGTDRKDLAGGSDGVLTWDGNTILHTGNMAQYIGVAQASLEE